MKRTRELTAAALLAALLAASAWVTVPIGPVPVTLQVFVVVLAALLLRPGWAAAAAGVYLLAGAVGLPVFSGARGGLGVLFGPTGGYLLGFVLGAWAGAVVRATLARAGARGVVTDAVASVAVIGVVYLLGWAQLLVVTQMGPVAALAAGVAPFVALDAAKAAVAVVAAAALRRAGVAVAEPVGASR